LTKGGGGGDHIVCRENVFSGDEARVDYDPTYGRDRQWVGRVIRLGEERRRTQQGVIVSVRETGLGAQLGKEGRGGPIRADKNKN